MKPDSPEAKQFLSLIQQLKGEHEIQTSAKVDPAIQLAMSFLTWNATQQQAEEAYGRLMEVFVDINELRVAMEYEVVELLGPTYPQGAERAARMREALQELFVREHATSMASVQSKGKKEQRAYLETLPGITPYVMSQVALLSFGAHAVPVDEKLKHLLVKEKIVDASLTPAEIEAMLLRVVKAADALETHQLLQAWSDGSRVTARQIEAVQSSLVVPASADAAGKKPKPPAAKKATKKA